MYTTVAIIKTDLLRKNAASPSASLFAFEVEELTL